MPRLAHPHTRRTVDVPEQNHQLLRYYRGEGYLVDQVEQLPDGQYVDLGPGLLEHHGYGEPLTGTEVPLGETADITNDPADTPGEPENDPDSGEQSRRRHLTGITKENQR